MKKEDKKHSLIVKLLEQNQKKITNNSSSIVKIIQLVEQNQKKITKNSDSIVKIIELLEQNQLEIARNSNSIVRLENSVSGLEKKMKTFFEVISKIEKRTSEDVVAVIREQERHKIRIENLELQVLPT